MAQISCQTGAIEYILETPLSFHSSLTCTGTLSEFLGGLATGLPWSTSNQSNCVWNVTITYWQRLSGIPAAAPMSWSVPAVDHCGPYKHSKAGNSWHSQPISICWLQWKTEGATFCLPPKCKFPQGLCHRLGLWNSDVRCMKRFCPGDPLEACSCPQMTPGPQRRKRVRKICMLFIY